MKKWCLILALALMVGCTKEGTPTDVKGAKEDFHVKKLFTVENCTVFRFLDSGRYHYLTNCFGKTMVIQDCGKNCQYEETIGN